MESFKDSDALYSEEIRSAVEKVALPSEVIQYPGGFRQYSFFIGTKLGIFWVEPHQGRISCKFDQTKKAREVYDCDPHSGVINFHGFSCLKDFKSFVNKIKNNEHLVDRAASNNLLLEYEKTWAEFAAWYAQNPL